MEQSSECFSIISFHTMCTCIYCLIRFEKLGYGTIFINDDCAALSLSEMMRLLSNLTIVALVPTWYEATQILKVLCVLGAVCMDKDWPFD